MRLALCVNNPLAWWEVRIGNAEGPLYPLLMETNGLEQRLVERWRHAAENLGILVTAPVKLRDASGQPFTCEALVHDFGSPTGAVVVSPRTERRVRHSLRSRGDELWVSGSGRTLSAYNRKHVIEELLDWGWFGKAGGEPAWYTERMPR